MIRKFNPNQTTINLSDTALTSLPEEIGKLRKLQEFRLNNTKIPIPDEIIKQKGNLDKIINYYLNEILNK